MGDPSRGALRLGIVNVNNESNVKAVGADAGELSYGE